MALASDKNKVDAATIAKWESEGRDRLGHKTRYSDSSFYDEKCTLCGGTDASGDTTLQYICSSVGGKGFQPTLDDVIYHLARMGADYSFNQDNRTILKRASKLLDTAKKHELLSLEALTDD